MNDNSNFNSSIKKIVSTVFVQALILAMSVITGFILPVKMGPEMFGYWQVYAFYLAYLNILGLGFNDGIALFYGGYDFEKLPFQRIRSAVRIFLIYLAAVTCLLFFIFSQLSNNTDREIYQLLTLNIPLFCLQCVVLTVFLSVNRTGVYNIVNLLSKLFAVLFYLILIFKGITSSAPMMYSDLLARFLITLLCIFLGRKILFGKADHIKYGIIEFREKSKSGINITLAIIASNFIPLVGRVIIEWNETKASYGLYSFAMSLLIIIVAFTSTAGTVVFPIIKRLQKEKLPDYYLKFSFICDALIYIALLSYIPLLFIIKHFMIDYIPVLEYVYILLAMCLPLGKMQLLVVAYYKAFRFEKAFFAANGIGVIAMLGFTALSYQIFKSVIAVAICTTVVLTLWTFFTERFLIKKMGCGFSLKSMVIQISMMLIFIFAGSFQNIFWFAGIYGSALIVYFSFHFKKIGAIIKQMKRK